MTLYLVSEREILHRCPAWPDPHTVQVERTILHITPGRACLSPVTIRIGDTVATVDCGRHEPYERQCSSCRTIVTTYVSRPLDLGVQQPTPTAPVPWRISRKPCPTCSLPMAAFLDCHLLCPPPKAWCR
jgi:hypothetical protein